MAILYKKPINAYPPGGIVTKKGTPASYTRPLINKDDEEIAAFKTMMTTPRVKTGVTNWDDADPIVREAMGIPLSAKRVAELKAKNANNGSFSQVYPTVPGTSDFDATGHVTYKIYDNKTGDDVSEDFQDTHTVAQISKLDPDFDKIANRLSFLNDGNPLEEGQVVVPAGGYTVYTNNKTNNPNYLPDDWIIGKLTSKSRFGHVGQPSDGVNEKYFTKAQYLANREAFDALDWGNTRTYGAFDRTNPKNKVANENAIQADKYQKELRAYYAKLLKEKEANAEAKRQAQVRAAEYPR